MMAATSMYQTMPARASTHSLVILNLAGTGNQLGPISPSPHGVGRTRLRAIRTTNERPEAGFAEPLQETRLRRKLGLKIKKRAPVPFGDKGQQGDCSINLQLLFYFASRLLWSGHPADTP